jgi:F0F1-type ATP synthase membrane subunit c/vacuolar-type H+-ATPase subunit K
MTERDPILKAMHDVGLAAWFGGSLMGVVGLNGAAAAARDPRERLRIASIGWDRWTPINAAAIGAHLIGGAGMRMSERRPDDDEEGPPLKNVKTCLTLAALAATAYSRWLGMQMERPREAQVEGVTEPARETPDEVSAAQRRQRLAQWAVPALTGTLVAVSAIAHELEKPRGLVRGVGARAARALIPFG